MRRSEIVVGKDPCKHGIEYRNVDEGLKFTLLFHRT